MKYEHLFSDIKLGKVTIKNRTAMMPMGLMNSCQVDVRSGILTKRGSDYYINIAKGGVGLIYPSGFGAFGMMCPTNDPKKFVKEQKYMIDGVHKYGAKVFTQIALGLGRQNWNLSGPAPSVLPNVWDPNVMHPEMTREEIKSVVKTFGEVARLVKEVGYDGIEVHAMHEGYLLDEFTMEFFNHRTDEYGGSFENRMRLAVEVLQEAKKICGDDFPVGMRFSARSYLKGFNRGAVPGEEYTEVGRTLEEGIKQAKYLEKAGYDFLNCDGGTYDSWYWAHPPVYMPKACNLETSIAIKHAVNIPVICAGKFDEPDLAEKAISNNDIDMMGIGRALLADPEIVNKFKEGKLEDIRPCVGCHQGCFSKFLSGQPLTCAVNPVCGREEEVKIEKATSNKHIIIVGGGLAGMEAARISTIRGYTVDLYDKGSELGGVFIASSQPEFKVDDRQLLNWYRRQMPLLGVNVHLNTEVTPEMLNKLTYEELIICTGSTERNLNIPGTDKENMTYAVDALINHRDFEGDNLVIIGGGLTGCELAYEYAKAGKYVTVVETTGSVMNVDGLNAANYNLLRDLMDYNKVKILTNTTLDSIVDKKANLTQTIYNTPNIADRAKHPVMIGNAGKKQDISILCDFVIVSIGYLSNQKLYDSCKGPHTHLLGDAVRPKNVMNAITTAFELARTL
ncbi:MAG TPA: FAD-dependent oxidoreductase [Ignavibacteria bacterium]